MGVLGLAATPSFGATRNGAVLAGLGFAVVGLLAAALVLDVGVVLEGVAVTGRCLGASLLLVDVVLFTDVFKVRLFEASLDDATVAGDGLGVPGRLDCILFGLVVLYVGVLVGVVLVESDFFC